MKIKTLFSVSLVTVTLLIIPLSAYAIPTCSGDVTACNITTDGIPLIKFILLAIPLAGFAWGVVNLAPELAKNFFSGDNPQVKKELAKRFINLFAFTAVGLLAVSLVIMVLSSISADGSLIDVIKKLGANVYNVQFVDHAYAQTTTSSGLYSPVPTDKTPFDWIIIIFKGMMEFAVLPMLIALWAYTGWLFVSAQGSSTQIAKAKNYILYSVMWTVILLLIQAFLFALQGPFNALLTSH